MFLHKHKMTPSGTTPLKQAGVVDMVHFINVTARNGFSTTSSVIQTLHGYEIHLSTANSRLSTMNRYKK